MALIGNRSVLSKHPGRNIGGGAIGLGMNRSDFGKATHNRARFDNLARDPKSGTPDGYRAPYAWVLPQTAGAMVSRNLILGTSAFAGAGARGVNGEAALSGAGAMAGAGALIVSAVAALAGSGTLAANVVAVLAAAAALTGAGTLAGAMTAKGALIAALTGAGVLAAPAYATGELEANITPFADLSPQSLAAAVWEALAAGYDEAGTMGEKMNNAASAGDPWGTALPGSYAAGQAGHILGNLFTLENGVENGLTVQQALRLIAAALAGELSGAATTTIVIRNAVADSKDRITATVDADGNRSAIVVDLT